MAMLPPPIASRFPLRCRPRPPRSGMSSAVPSPRRSPSRLHRSRPARRRSPDAETNVPTRGTKLFGPVVDEVVLRVDVVALSVRQGPIVEDERLAVSAELAHPVSGTPPENGLPQDRET